MPDKLSSLVNKDYHCDIQNMLIILFSEVQSFSPTDIGQNAPSNTMSDKLNEI